jgi:EAL domain-containing protein (putative c-di-GMP-specific phosphodiesterase class I)
LLKNAHAAFESSKYTGKFIYKFYSDDVDTEAREYIKLKQSLSNAIKNNELVILYQPKFHIKRGNIIGVEALLRWNHPQLGMLSPSKFIPLAEETGLINQIGEWILREACKANKHWQDENYEHICVGVNLSPKQFYDPMFTSYLTKVLSDTGMNPNFLELEITEKTVMDDLDAATDILQKIKSTGVQLSIDHFGTGYTSISHLKRFPINTVKIDSSFIKGIPHIPNDVAITNAFISLVHHLGLEVVAEGVETEDQMQYLTSQNCDIIQGFFLSKPLNEEEIILEFKKIMDKVL